MNFILSGMNLSKTNKWRSTTEEQKRRNSALFLLNKEEKIEFIKWAKQFDSDPLGYIKLCNRQYPLPENNFAKILALGYVSDISEVKRLHHEEDTQVEWTPIPFGIKQNEWNDPDTIKP